MILRLLRWIIRDYQLSQFVLQVAHLTLKYLSSFSFSLLSLGYIQIIVLHFVIL